jgi:predicted dehydrogenase/nucleoside-diphosphate-sugar epimerase
LPYATALPIIEEYKMVVRVGLIGAGFISSVHADAIAAIPGLSVSAVIDPNFKAAERLAKARGAKAFASLEEAVAANAIDRVHALVPPDLHYAVGKQAIAAGIPVLLEKPICTESGEARELIALAAEKNIALGVNQNFMFHPALLKFLNDNTRGKFGRLRHVSLVCAVPLRQLDAKQFGHWMFRTPYNIILEQLVHPLSQLVRVAGLLNVTSAVAQPSQELAPGLHFHRGFDVSLNNDLMTAQLHMAFGENFPVWQMTVSGDDGNAVIDMFADTYVPQFRTRWMGQADALIVGVAMSVRQACGALKGLLKYGGSQVKLVGRSDQFFVGIKNSVAAFHEAVTQNKPLPVTAETGLHLVELCEKIGTLADVSKTPAKPIAKLIGASDPVPHYDVAVFGGTGFIGKHLVKQLLDANYAVGVIARNTAGLPSHFSDPRLTLVRGDVTKREDIARGIGSAKLVVNLAHGGASGSRETIVDALVGSARTMGEVCLEKQVTRLVHVGSIAGLNLGDPNEIIRPSTPADTEGDQRGDYSFAKAEADRVLLTLHKTRGLPVTIQRPGVVVGSGTIPFHSGLGVFNNDQHCLGWNNGRNALPFVLVEDTASAIVCALKADEAVNGRTDNIVGGVRLTAREYYDELVRVSGRPLRYHPQSIWIQQAIDIVKWAIKRVGGRTISFPSLRDLKSRGMSAPFDTNETESVLNWAPVKDRATFVAKGIHATLNG